MIKTLIIEDEKPAAEHLQKLISSIGYEILADKIIDSVTGAVKWFSTNPHPDLVFMDIQLSDGLSFEIFDYVRITSPVIFTTAYEDYAIRAFKVNSIDYLLKPINTEALSLAIEKFLSLSLKGNPFDDLFHFQVGKVMQLLTKKYKSRFVVNAGVHIRSIETERINCFYSMEKTTYLLDNTGKSYDTNYTLEQLEELTDPENFFRINRKYLVNRSAITDIISFSGNSLKIKVNQVKDEDTITSHSRSKDFRQWLEK